MASSRNSGSPDRFLDNIAAALRRHFTASAAPQRLVVGLSGGRDSVALLFALKELQARFAYGLTACHVHHGLSPYAAEWQAFCAGYCTELGVPFEVVSVSVPRGSPEGLEAAARRLRYEAFATLDADWLMLAQHRGDQAETLLFNLLRGSGLGGARAMPEVRLIRPGLQLMRPLLGSSRREIDAYLLRHALQWVEDESNADVRFSRNFLRHRILPELLARFPAAEQRLAATAAHLAEAHVLLDDLALVDLAGRRARFPIPLVVLKGLSEPRGRNVLRYLLAQHQVMIPSEARLKEALRQLLEAEIDRHPAVAFGDWRLLRERGEVRLEKTLGMPADNKLK